MNSDEDAYRRPDWKLPIETEKQIVSLLGLTDGQLPQLRDDLAYLASRYLRHRNQDIDTPTQSAQRKILAAVTRITDPLAIQLDLLAKSPDAEFTLRETYKPVGDMLDGDETAHPLENDIQHFRRFAQAVKVAHADFLVRTGPSGPDSLRILVGDLCRLYQALTGKAATHSAKDKTQYIGVPRSLAGRFVTISVTAIDQGITAREATTAMRYVVRPARKARSQSSGPKGRGTL